MYITVLNTLVNPSLAANLGLLHEGTFQKLEFLHQNKNTFMVFEKPDFPQKMYLFKCWQGVNGPQSLN